MTDRSVDLGELRRLASLILDLQTPAFSLRPEVLELTALFSRLGPTLAEPDQAIDVGETPTSSGLAISPTMAAMCADDYGRTIQFLRGTYAAIAEARVRARDRPVRILYVGCGPFALLATPLMAVLSPEEAVFTLLDIHEASIESVKSIVDTLGLSDSVEAYETTDASSYTIDREQAPDVLLMEIMQACLQVEPQVSVARHLVPQAPEAILIPEEVLVDLRFVDPGKEFDPEERDRSTGKTVFRLNPERIESWAGITGTRLPASSCRVPEPYDPRLAPMLFTNIRVFGDHGLGDYDSGLTSPLTLRTDFDLRAGQRLQFHYELGDDPQLVCEAGDSTNPDQPAAS